MLQHDWYGSWCREQSGAPVQPVPSTQLPICHLLRPAPRLLRWGSCCCVLHGCILPYSFKIYRDCFSGQMNKIASECKDTQDIAVNNSYAWAQYFTSLPNQLEREAGAFLMVEGLKYRCFCAEFTLHRSLSLSLCISAHPRCTDIYLPKAINLWLFMGAASLEIQVI